MRALSQVTDGVGGLECPLGRPVGDGQQGLRAYAIVCRAGIPNSHASTGGLWARVADSCGVLRIDRGRWSTGLYTAGRGLCSNVGAEMAAEASGGVAAAGGARASGRARSETGRQDAETK